MSQPELSAHPTLSRLTPSLCFDTSTLRQFLRASRASIDDPLPQHLSALSRPSSSPFDYTSIDNRTTRPATRLSQRTCGEFLAASVFPAWKARSQVLEYCGSVAGTTVSRQQEGSSQDSYSSQNSSESLDEQSPSTTMTRPDPRLDPYGARDYGAKKETREEALARTVQEERSIESIIRTRSWGLIMDRCGASGTWQGALESWKSGRTA